MIDDLEGLQKRIRTAQIASCSCRTKPPQIEYHDPACRYRLFVEAEQAVEELIELRQQVEDAAYEMAEAEARADAFPD